MNWIDSPAISIIGPTQFKDIIKIKTFVIFFSKSYVMHKLNNKDYCHERIGFRIQFRKWATAIYYEKAIAMYISSEYSLAK